MPTSNGQERRVTPTSSPPPEIRNCQYANKQREHYEKLLARTVKDALTAGVPLNTLARALGVSRNRVRRLAR